MNIERLVAEMKKASGASRVVDWSLYATESRRLGLGVKDREAGNAHAPLTLTEAGGLRYLFVWEDGRVSRGLFERTQYEDDPAGALELARSAAYEDADAAYVSSPAELPEVATHDPGAAAIAGGDVTLFAERLATIRERIASDPVGTWSGSFSAAEARSRLVTSAGFEGSGLSSSVGWHVTLDGQIGDGYSSRAADGDDEFHRRLDRLLALAAELRTEAPAMEEGVRPILLHPRVVEEYVIDTLLSNLDGASVAHGSGAFSADQFDGKTPFFRDDLGLRVDPLVPMKRGSYRFTSEGVPAERCAFIENGCLVRPVLGLKYARRLGLEPTAAPAASDTIHLEGSTPLSLDEALGRADGGAVVLSVLGVHTQDSTSGDFSLSAPQVLSVENGGYAGKLRATISGNLFEILRSAELQWVSFEGETTPGLLYPGRIDPR